MKTDISEKDKRFSKLINTLICEQKKENSYNEKNDNYKQNNIDKKLNLSRELLLLNNEKYENIFLKENVFVSSVIGQIFKLYILLENKKKNQLIIIDMHALHEKIIYTQLKLLKTISFKIQKSLLLQFSKSENILIEKNIFFLKKNGFEMTKFGFMSYIIKKIPLFLKNVIEEKLFIKEIILEICKDNRDIYNNKIIDDYIKKIS